MTESLKSIITNIDRVCEAHPIMTVEEERELCFRLKDDRPMLEEKLVLHNIRFMQSVVSRYTDRCEGNEDRIMRGMLGLIRAARAFDVHNGCRFCTYARFHIKNAFRDLYDPFLAAPRTHRNTSASLNTPVSNHSSKDEGSDTCVIDLLSPGKIGCEATWNPPQPGDYECSLAERVEYGLMVDYLVEQYLYDIPLNHKQIIRMWMLGRTYQAIGVSMGCSMQNVAQVILKHKPALQSAVKYDRSFGIDRIRRPTTTSEVGPKDVGAFLSENRVTLAAQGVSESKEKHIMRIMDGFDAAAEQYVAATGCDRSGADMKIMRKVYEDNIARRTNLKLTSLRFGLPMPYAKFLRDRAVRMVKDAKKGVYRKIIARSPVGGSVSEDGEAKARNAKFLHAFKDRLFNVGSSSGCKTTNYDRIGTMLRSRRDLIRVCSPYRGNFYSHVGMGRTQKTKNGKVVMSMRELSMHVRLGNVPKLSPERLSDVASTRGLNEETFSGA